MTKNTKQINKLIFQFYWKEAWRYPKFAGGIVLILPVTVFFHQFLPPLIAAKVLDKLTVRAYQPQELWQVFGSSLMWYTAATFLGAVLLWRLTILLNWSLENYVIRDITRRAFDHLMRLDANFHANTFGGSLVSQVGKLGSAYIRIADAFQFQIYGLIISLVLTSVFAVGAQCVVCGGDVAVVYCVRSHRRIYYP